MAAAARAPMPWSAVAGAVQAAGSAIGKFATSAESGIVVPTIAKCHASVLDSANTPLGMQLPAYTCDLLEYAIRGVLLLTLIFSNTYGLALHLRGMQQSGSFLATVMNTGANFIVTALLGWAIFGESLSLLWWFGGTLIAAGTVLVASGSAASASSTTAADTQGAASKQDAPISSRTRRKAE